MPTLYPEAPFPRMYFGATADGYTDDTLHKKYAQEWYRLTPLRGDAWRESARCAHRLIGKRCPSKKDNKYAECELMRRYEREGIWDHARAWRSAYGDLVFTLEPWGSPIWEANRIGKLATELEQLGIAMSFEGRAPYGSSYVLILADAESESGQFMGATCVPYNYGFLTGQED